MFILPYQISSRTFQTIQITSFRCLTIGGACLWSEKDELDVIRDILEPNGIYLAAPPMRVKDIVFCQVDATRTNLADQYVWEELPIGDRHTFCWRTYYLMGNDSNMTYWLPVPSTECLEPYSFQDIVNHFSQVPRTPNQTLPISRDII